VAWDEVFPSTLLSSLTRTTSDHVPLKIDIATSIPKSNLFRFENFWVHDTGFRTVVDAAWNLQNDNSDPSAVLAAKLKNTRFEIRAWRKLLAICAWKRGIFTPYSRRIEIVGRYHHNIHHSIFIFIYIFITLQHTTVLIIRK
jgi:hypothetical protein